MSSIHDDNKREAEKALCIKIERMLGRPSTGLRDILHILSHPDVSPEFDEWVGQVMIVRMTDN